MGVGGGRTSRKIGTADAAFHYMMLAHTDMGLFVVGLMQLQVN